MIRFILIIQICFSTFLVFGQNDTLFSYYPSGELMSAYPQKDSLNHGLSLRYYPSGVVQMKSNWSYGKLEGESFSYYLDGELQSFMNYRDGIVNESLMYYKNGNIWSTSLIRKGKEKSKSFYMNEKRQYKSFTNGSSVTCIVPEDKTYIIDENTLCYYGDIQVYVKDEKYFDVEGNEIKIKHKSRVQEWYSNGKRKSLSIYRNKKLINKKWDEEGNLIIEI